MKKILSLNSIPRKVSTEEKSTQVKVKNEIKQVNRQPQPIIKLIYYILYRGSIEGDSAFYDAILKSYEFISQQHDISNTLSNQLFEKYLELIWNGLGLLEPFELHQIGSLAYNTLSTLRANGTISNHSNPTIIFLHLIPLISISQPEVVDALLDGLLIQLSKSIASRAIVVEFGLDPLFSLLTKSPVKEKTSNLISSLFLTLISEGIHSLLIF